MPYLLARSGALLLGDAESSEESEDEGNDKDKDTERENSLMQRELVTICIDSLRLETFPLTINSQNLMLKEICNTRLLLQLLHTLYRDYHNPQNQHTFAHYVALLNKSLHWESLKTVLDSQTYDSLSTLLQKTETSHLEAEGYRFFFETIAKAVEFPFATEIHPAALTQLCNELALKKTPTFEMILACFRPPNTHNLSTDAPKKNKFVRTCVGLACCINDYFKDKKATSQTLLRLYTSIGQQTTHETS